MKEIVSVWVRLLMKVELKITFQTYTSLVCPSLTADAKKAFLSSDLSNCMASRLKLNRQDRNRDDILCVFAKCSVCHVSIFNLINKIQKKNTYICAVACFAHTHIHTNTHTHTHTHTQPHPFRLMVSLHLSSPPCRAVVCSLGSPSPPPSPASSISFSTHTSS